MEDIKQVGDCVHCGKVYDTLKTKEHLSICEGLDAQCENCHKTLKSCNMENHMKICESVYRF